MELRKAAMGQSGFVDPKAARRLHEDGFSCLSTAAYKYDANGHKRWCIDCGAELDEQAYHPDGADVPAWFFALAIIGVAVAVLAVAIPTILAGRPANQPDDRGRVATPMPHQGPPVGW